MMEVNGTNSFMNEAEWERLLKFISERKMTLVIGDDIIRYKSQSISNVLKESLIDYIKEQCNKKLVEGFKYAGLEASDIPLKRYEEEYNKYGIGKNDSPSVITLCEHSDFFTQTTFGSIEFVVKNILDNLKSDLLDLSGLHRLLEIDRFNIIISTSFTNIPKSVIQEYCQEKNRIFYYGEIINNTLKIESPNVNGVRPWSGRDDEILFISLMGSDGNNYSLDNLILSEESIISLVYSWISAINLHSSSTVKDQLSKRYLLTLGCHIPSWAFRFVWYLIKNPLGISTDTPSICTRPLPYNENVKKFILRNSTKIIEAEKSFDFINLLITRWKDCKYSNINRTIENETIPRSTDVFVSYASEDREFVMNNIIPLLLELKKENNISFWFDKNDIRVGDDWEDDILYAVTHSRVFLVIQTPTTQKISIDPHVRYLREEWRTAKKFQKEFDEIVNNESEGIEHFHYILPIVATNEEECIANSFRKIQYIQMTNLNFNIEFKEHILSMINENKKYGTLY